MKQIQHSKIFFTLASLKQNKTNKNTTQKPHTYHLSITQKHTACYSSWLRVLLLAHSHYRGTSQLALQRIVISLTKLQILQASY